MHRRSERSNSIRPDAANRSEARYYRRNFCVTVALAGLLSSQLIIRNGSKLQILETECRGGDYTRRAHIPVLAIDMPNVQMHNGNAQPPVS